MREMTLRETERVTGLSRHFLSEQVRQGLLPARRIGRALVVELEDVRAWWRSTAGPLNSAGDEVRRDA